MSSGLPKSKMLIILSLISLFLFSVDSMADRNKNYSNSILSPYLAYVDTTVVGPTVLASFVVDKKGNINSIKILKNECGFCSEEQKKRMEDVVINMINQQKWTPGKQKGRPVDVKFTLPVRFAIIADSVYIPPIEKK